MVLCETLPGSEALLAAALPAGTRPDVSSFVRAVDREVRLLCRLLVVRLLESHGIGPEEFFRRVSVGAHGKPASPHPLRWNVSHAGVLAAAAVSFAGDVGVDVERITPDPDCGVLSPAEARLIAESAAPDETFTRLWTRKEAVLKADGRGLSVPPVEVDVSGDVARLGGSCWRITDLAVPPGYRGAVAGPEAAADVGSELWGQREVVEGVLW